MEECKDLICGETYQGALLIGDSEDYQETILGEDVISIYL